MTRLEIKQAFRAENPDIPQNVVTDITLNSWLIEGNRDFCEQTGCIAGSASFTATVGVSEYDLSDSDADSYVENFLEIDEYPGGGVAFDDDRLTENTKAELDANTRSWRTNSNGVPTKYYRRGEKIVFDRPASEAKTIDIDTILYPDDFNSDDITPFNQLKSLQNWSYGLVYYLTYRAKRAKKKDAEGDSAMALYLDYVKRAKKKIRKATYGTIQFIPKH